MQITGVEAEFQAKYANTNGIPFKDKKMYTSTNDKFIYEQSKWKKIKKDRFKKTQKKNNQNFKFEYVFLFFISRYLLSLFYAFMDNFKFGKKISKFLIEFASKFFIN